MTIGLSSPWIITYKKIRALFSLDETVDVAYDDEKKTIKVFTTSTEKAAALDILLKKEYDFGNVKLTVSVIPPNEEFVGAQAKALKAVNSGDMRSVYKTAFCRNDAFADIYNTPKAFMGGLTYVIFMLSPVQIYTDDISCWQGYRTFLVEDIAREVIEHDETVFMATETAKRR